MRTSDLLAAIESKAQWLKLDADAMADFMARLPLQRNFYTLAESAMDEAEAALIDALRIVRLCRNQYHLKPQEQNHENLRHVREQVPQSSRP
jgi:hypothetical protein